MNWSLMTVTTASIPKTYHVLYGWAEGPWHGQQLIQSLHLQGYHEASLNQASILITHSAGGYIVPTKSNYKFILVIGLPYWPGKSLALCGIRKVWHDFLAHRSNLAYWLQKTSWNLVYLVRRPLYNLQLIRATKKKDYLSSLPTQAVIVRNQNDDFCAPDITKHVSNHVITLPGQHDDCWQNPTPYVDLLNLERL